MNIKGNVLFPNRTISITGKDINLKKEEIKRYFNYTFSIYEKLFEVIKDEKSFYKKPEPLRHPLIFYFGHTATFFINKLITAKFLENRVNQHYESTFAIGVDEMSWDDLDETNYDWPSVIDVREYRKKVNLLVNDFIDEMDFTLPIKQSSPAWIILMGIEHERIHLETSAVIIRMLDINDVQSTSFINDCQEHGDYPLNQLIEVKGKDIELGKTSNSDVYGWDNEYGIKDFKVSNFQASKYLVSNGEYLEFINDSGYSNKKYWNKEGSSWLAYTKQTIPFFWILKEDKYFLRNLTSEIELPLNWPVEVNQLEASAFCSWKSTKLKKKIRLPLEEEWHILNDSLNLKEDIDKEINANVGLEKYTSSCPVNMFQQGDFFDVKGNVWQWTNSSIQPFEGFKVHPAYDDFSMPTFDGKHNIMKGGSWISTGNEAISTSRYAFRRHFYQFCGFRYIIGDDMQEKNESNIYESDNLISQYLDFHYGESHFNVKNFPKACVDSIMDSIKLEDSRRCLDLGCSVGRSTFELAKYFDHVDGIDFSARFIQMGHMLQNEKKLDYLIHSEGEIKIKNSISLEKLFPETKLGEISFSQGDACNLKDQFCNYDLVFGGNLIDRLYDPEIFLTKIGKLINSQGYLVLTSPYTWLEEYTPKEKWVGGYYDKDGNEILSIEGLKAKLENDFDFIENFDVPFVIRETSRKFQHTLADLSIWQKK